MVGRIGRVGDVGWVLPDRATVRLTALAAGCAALVLGLIVALDIGANSEAAGERLELVSFALLGGWSFVLAGAIAHAREPRNRVGTLMIAVGLAWLVGQLNWTPRSSLVLSLSLLVGWLWAALLAHLMLAFPSGRLVGRPALVLTAAAYVIALPVRALWTVLSDQAVFFARWDRPPGCTCPDSLLSTGGAPELADALRGLDELAVTAVGLSVCGVLVLRWRSSTPVQRRALAPVLLVSVVTGAAVALSTTAQALGADRAANLLSWGFNAGLIIVPFAFLAGLVTTRLRGAAGLTGLLDELDGVQDSRRLDAALGRALGDDSARAVYWLPAAQRYVDAQGHAVDLRDERSRGAVTRVERDGEPVAALVHDPSLAGEARFVRAVGRTAVLWLERARLEAERNARMVELQESRARLVEATDAERRRIERDLHDGAQQRLAGLLLHSRLRRRAFATPADAEALFEDLERGLTEALAELRALAAGILPPVLTDHGLPAAVEELAARCPVPVFVQERDVGRLPPRVEAAAYFVVAEALANVIKHARAEQVVVRLARRGVLLVVEIADDGVGITAQGGGSGLRGLADRVGALEGTLTCESAGGGTVLRAEIPCAS